MKQKADVAAAQGGELRVALCSQIAPGDAHRALVASIEAGYDAEQSRFAGAGGTVNGGERARLDLQVEAV